MITTNQTIERSVPEITLPTGMNGLGWEPGRIAGQLVFGGRHLFKQAQARMNGKQWPVLWVEGDCCDNKEICTVQTAILSEQTVRPLILQGQTIGSTWSDNDAEYCLLAGILPKNTAASRDVQTWSCFEQIESALGLVQMNFSHVVRTWLYLDQLLDWYGEFNAVRTRFFESRGVFKGLVPASTGIGAGNPAGAALVAGTLAMRPKHPGMQIREVPSPLQCPATNYQSSFSRAVELTSPARRMLMISGTASIASGGESLYQNDVTKQINYTLDVVEAILKSRNMGWKNTLRAVGYFRDIGAQPILNDILQRREIAPLPLIAVHATVCRDDLLFELELDACQTASNPS